MDDFLKGIIAESVAGLEEKLGGNFRLGKDGALHPAAFGSRDPGEVDEGALFFFLGLLEACFQVVIHPGPCRLRLIPVVFAGRAGDAGRGVGRRQGLGDPVELVAHGAEEKVKGCRNRRQAEEHAHAPDPLVFFFPQAKDAQEIEPPDEEDRRPEEEEELAGENVLVPARP